MKNMKIVKKIEWRFRVQNQTDNDNNCADFLSVKVGGCSNLRCTIVSPCPVDSLVYAQVPSLSRQEKN